MHFDVDSGRCTNFTEQEVIQLYFYCVNIVLDLSLHVLDIVDEYCTSGFTMPSAISACCD
jgi:hypothetical protein